MSPRTTPIAPSTRAAVRLSCSTAGSPLPVAWWVPAVELTVTGSAGAASSILFLPFAGRQAASLRPRRNARRFAHSDLDLLPDFDHAVRRYAKVQVCPVRVAEHVVVQVL